MPLLELSSSPTEETCFFKKKKKILETSSYQVHLPRKLRHQPYEPASGPARQGASEDAAQRWARLHQAECLLSSGELGQHRGTQKLPNNLRTPIWPHIRSSVSTKILEGQVHTQWAGMTAFISFQNTTHGGVGHQCTRYLR